MESNKTISLPADPSPWSRTAVVVIVSMSAVLFLGGLTIQRISPVNEQFFDPDGWGKMGFQLAAGKGLLDGDGNLSAFRGPVVPIIYATTAMLWGPSYDALLVTQCIFFALAGCLMGILCQRLFGDWRVTLIAMGLYLAFVPAYPWFCHIFTEPIFTALLAAFMIVWTAGVGKSARRSLLTGMALAVTALCKPVMFYFLPLVLLYELRVHGWHRRALQSAGAILIGFLLLEVPWVVRNYVSLDRLIVTTTGSAQALFLATWYQEANWMGNPYHDPHRFSPAGEGFWKLPKMERERRFREMAIKNVREAPGQVLLLIPKRTMVFLFQLNPRGWLPTPKSIILTGFLYTTAILGFRQLTRKQRLDYTPVLMLVIFNIAFHSLLVSEYRYSHPIQPYIFILSAVSVVAIASKRLPWPSPQ